MTKTGEAIAGYKAFEQAFYRGDADAISRMYTETRSYLLLKLPFSAADRPSRRSGKPSLVPAATRST